MSSMARLSAAATKNQTLLSIASQLRLQRSILQWRALQLAVTPRPATGKLERLIVLASDPWQLIGSKGDEAMLTSCVARLAAGRPQLHVGVLTADPDADRAAKRLGYEALPVWREPWKPRTVMTAIDDFRPDALIVIGADVMDGYYDPMMSLRLVSVADLVARRGVPSAIVGFSFNAKPYPGLKTVWKHASPALHVNVRDTISHERFRAFTGRNARLVADVAFMLEPVGSRVQAGIAGWVERRHALGDRVIAFNLHPQLIRKASEAQLDELVASAAEALRIVLRRRPLSVLLLAHDYRPRDRDDRCLQPIAAALSTEFGDRVAHPTDAMSAAELKSVASLTDGVVAGRMHLAIASLGSGVPVMALTYQDKFQGLLEHFQLPHSLLVAPEDFLAPSCFAAKIEAFVLALDSLRGSVRAVLPAVLRASEDNFRALLP